MVSYENAVELTEIILNFFGLNTGLFSNIKSVINISKENKASDKQKFIDTMENSIHSFLSDENVTDDVFEKLKDTFQNHFDLQKLVEHFEDQNGFCSLLAETQYSKKEQRTDSSFSAYNTALKGIVEAVYAHLNLFDVGSATDIAILKQLCNYDSMFKLYGEILNENNYLLHYKNSFAEYIDNAVLPPNITTNKFSYLNPNIGFYGRKNELDAIQEFLEQDKKFSVWAITGPGGIGKSKFARYIAEKYQYKMGVIWLTDNDFTRISTIINTRNDIGYYRTILFICDYASSKSDKLDQLINVMVCTEYKVRFLLLERSPEWYSRFLNEQIYADEHKYIHNINDASPINLSDSVFSKYEYYAIIDDFSGAYYQTAISNNDKDQIIKFTEGLSNNNTQRLKSARCLFLLLAADAYLNHTDIHKMSSWDAKALMKNYIDRSKKMIRDNYSEGLMIPAYRILALATALGGLDLEEKYSSEIQNDINDLINSLGKNRSAIYILLGQLSETTINSMTAVPLLPDIVGEYLFIEEFSNLMRCAENEWITLIYDSEYGRTFLSRCIADWGIKVICAYIVKNSNIDKVYSSEILCDAILELQEFEAAHTILEVMEELITEESTTKILEHYTLAITYMIKIAKCKEHRHICLEKIKRLEEVGIPYKDDIATAKTHSYIGLIYDDMGIYGSALEHYQKALTLSEKKLAPDHSDIATLYNNIGVLYYNLENYPTALAYFQKAIKICEKKLGKNHPNTKIVMECIKATKDKMK